MAPIKIGRPAVAIALFVGFGAPISGKADAIDRYVTSQMQRLHIPGASLAIVRDGHIIKAQGYGFANLELKAPATKKTVYEIGSNTKQFTAAAIMMLVEEGKVALEDSITKYFPEAPQAWRDITIRHLLTHTSGIQNHVAVPHWLDVFRTNLAFETAPPRDELLNMFFKLPLEFQPGESWAYDNTGYYLLGVIIEQVSGKSYWKFLDDRIFKPLDMNATQSTHPQPIVPNRASVSCGRPLRRKMERMRHSLMASAGSSTATTVIDSSSTVAERRVFRQSSTGLSMTN